MGFNSRFKGLRVEGGAKTSLNFYPHFTALHLIRLQLLIYRNDNFKSLIILVFKHQDLQTAARVDINTLEFVIWHQVAVGT